MRIFFIIGLFLVGCITSYENGKFEGKLVYQISSVTHHTLDSVNFQTIYAKDSLVRIENYSPIGKQVFIKHIPKNRAYLLIEVQGEKFAIKSIPQSDSSSNEYQVKQKLGKKNILGLPSKKLEVFYPEIDSSLIVIFTPEISSTYNEAISYCPGLPIEYYLVVNQQLLKYQLIEFSKEEIDLDYFGIPSDYQIVTLDEFIDSFQK